ncbi:MAG TPA: phosphoenolpyruvate carboxykinase (ATP), partial [Gemmatimonadales bacterium]|nr:phosphoenolpyruvate carboxykinase (ATP) [Gemmatimonadales bacterium]
MRLVHTRAMVRAALAGKLDKITNVTEPVFGLSVPQHVPGVPDEVLLPRKTWSDQAAYDAMAVNLAALFKNNFVQFQDQVPTAVREAGPRS